MAEPIVIHAETCNGDTYEIRYYRASDYDALLAEVDRLREWQRKMIDAVNSGKIYLIHALIEETDHDNRQ